MKKFNQEKYHILEIPIPAAAVTLEKKCINHVMKVM